jgi:hypothetical protein
MCIYGIFRNDLGFYCFQRKETTISKEDTSNSKHSPPKNPQQIQVFNGMAHFYKTFIKNFVAIMAPKMTRKPKTFFCTKECLKAWELIKKTYIEAPILISQNWQVEFHVHMSQPHFGQV